MLEWRPRVIFVVLALLALAIMAGYGDFGLDIVDNWEW
jgi:hypothetical protein